jgi:uncharacterized protein involved in exopolysaccharide biosynthesis
MKLRRGIVATFGLGFAVVFTVLAAVVLNMRSIYSAEAYVLLAQRIEPMPGPEAQIWGPSEQLVDTEVEVLRSPYMAKRVAASLESIGQMMTAETVSSRVTVARLGLTYLAKITAEAPTPQLATSLANQYAEQYVAERIHASDEQPFITQDGVTAARPASQMEDGRLPNARVLAFADLPTAAAQPRLPLLMIVAFLTALAAGLLCATAAHLFSRRKLTRT